MLITNTRFVSNPLLNFILGKHILFVNNIIQENLLTLAMCLIAGKINFYKASLVSMSMHVMKLKFIKENISSDLKIITR